MATSGCDVYLLLYFAGAYVMCGDAWLISILLNNALHVYKLTVGYATNV